MAPVTEPFPISCIAGRYLLFDVDMISHARREHNICGVLIGTIPNLSQQNVFLGVPLELMPEEARVLVEQGHAYVVDDVQMHKENLLQMSREERLKFLAEMDQQGMERALEVRKKLEERSARALEKKGLTPAGASRAEPPEASTEEAGETSLFEPETRLVQPPKRKLEPHYITPATSYPPLSQPSVDSALPLPTVPRSYPLFRYMHGKGYFSMPGLRFGCHYSIYPGDPLRFHSHFLATGMDWDEEFELLDIVGGGRLGTGVKKGYLIGGEDPEGHAEKKDTRAESVRPFCIEWAGM